jgi:hypothetical protein
MLAVQFWGCGRNIPELPAVRDISLSGPQRIYMGNCFYFHAVVRFSS